MTVENVNIFSFGYRDYMITIWFCKHCCGQKVVTDKLWEWQVSKDGHVVFRQKETNKKDAEVHALAWVDSKVSVENLKEVVKVETGGNDRGNTSFEYKGLKVHIMFCRNCNQKLTKKIWQWCITEGGNGESKEDVEAAAKKWIDKMKGG